ncbi:MAG: CocE/NonD family hydrolase [Elainellaceae cyanobacterium]
MFPVLPKQTLSMTTRDGVRLDADVYRPDAEGEFPVLLMRQPYGRAIASTVVYAHPIWYAAHGYIVVIQDVRGRGSSQGDFLLFEDEIADGADTVAWAAALPGSNSSVGMYGFSYQGMTQLYAAAEQPAALKTLCPAMIGYDLHADWAYEGGAFCLQASLGWATQLAAETARRKGDRTAYEALYQAARMAPACDPVSGRSELLMKLAPDSFYHDWTANPDPHADYWQQLSPKTHLQNVDLPMLHIGGWYDTYMRGTLRFYKEMAARSRHLQHLWVGPWGHIPWGRRVGTQDFGPEANSPIDALQIRWFDHMLKGKPNGLSGEPPVRLFELGTNQWRSLPHWTESAPVRYFLQSNGLASIDQQAGRLSPDSPSADAELENPIPDVLVHDPWRPVPALGGHSTIPSGMVERSLLDSRADVLTYTSDPLPEDWSFAGELSVELTCSTDAPSFDLCAVLSYVCPSGQTYPLTQGYRRVAESPISPESSSASESSLPDAPQTIQINLQPVCARIKQGQCLRLSLSAACFPAYSLNSGTSQSGSVVGGGDRLLDARVITIQIHSSAALPSCLNLPEPLSSL